MYYELYIDILFLINLMMDVFLLLLVKKLLGARTTFLRILAAGVIGAAGICIVTVLPVRSSLVTTILLHGIISSIMVKTGLRTKGPYAFAKGFICLYLGGFLLGGAWQWMSGFWKNFMMISIGSFIILSLALHIQSVLQGKRQKLYQVSLYYQDNQTTVKALKDTGNSLRDPVGGQPVHIVEYGAVTALLTGQDRKRIEDMLQFQYNGEADSSTLKIHYVPFHSVGRKNGLLPAITADKMILEAEEPIEIRRPVIAICSEPLSVKENYQMILQPDVLQDHALLK